MAYYDEVKRKENPILVVEVCGYLCEVVEVDGAILLYVDGHFEGELFEEESDGDYISQIAEILD